MRPLAIDASVWVSAADATDALSEVSRTILAGVVARELPVALPVIAELEIACALARRLRDAEQGRSLAERMLRSPLITTHALNRARLREAMRLGTGSCLRSGDALYAAPAEELRGEVISWERELVERARALTPREWIDTRSDGKSPGTSSASPQVRRPIPWPGVTRQRTGITQRHAAVPDLRLPGLRPRLPNPGPTPSGEPVPGASGHLPCVPVRWTEIPTTQAPPRTRCATVTACGRPGTDRAAKTPGEDPTSSRATGSVSLDTRPRPTVPSPIA